MSWFIRVAAIAPLLVGFTSEMAFAQATDPAHSAGRGGAPPCYLTEEHQRHLQEQIDALKKRIEKLRKALEEEDKATDAVRPPTTVQPVDATKPGEDDEEDGATDTGEDAESDEAAKAAKQRHEEIVTELKKANEQLAALLVLHQAKVPPPPPPAYSGWHWGIGARGGMATLRNSSEETAWITQVQGLVRWVSETHLGVELVPGLGVWPTGNSAPFAVSGRLAGVASWDNWGLFVGPELSFLLTPFEGKKGGNILVTIPVGGEFKRGHFIARFMVGPSIHSELARQAGLWLGIELGFFD